MIKAILFKGDEKVIETITKEHIEKVFEELIKKLDSSEMKTSLKERKGDVFIHSKMVLNEAKRKIFE